MDFFAGLPLLAASIFVVSITARLVVEGQADKILLRPLVHFTGLFGTLFFMACMVAIAKKLLSGKPDLCVVESGLVFYPDTRRALRIPWASIEHLGEDRVRAEEFFSIRVRDADQVYRQAGRRLPALRWVNRMLGFGDFSISMRGTGMSAAALKEKVQDMAGNQLILSHS